MLSLICFNMVIVSGVVFVGKNATNIHSCDFVSLLVLSWKEPALQLTLFLGWCCYLSPFEEACLGLTVSIHCHPNDGSTLTCCRMLGRRGWVQGYTIHASLLGSKDFLFHLKKIALCQRTVMTVTRRSLIPGLPQLQLLIACSILQAIKSWSRGRPGNEARHGEPTVLYTVYSQPWKIQDVE